MQRDITVRKVKFDGLQADVRHIVLWTALVGGMTIRVQAQESLSLTDAVREALLNHPLLAAEMQRTAAARGFVQQANLRPNPRLFVQSENWSFSGTPGQSVSSFTDQFLYATQVIETGGKREHRVDLAQAGVELTQLDREVLIRRLAMRVKLAYWSAAGAERVLELLRESQKNFQQTIEYHEIQLREGAIAEADVIRMRLEGDRVALAVENAAREAETARIILQREMGRTVFSGIRLTETLEGQPEPTVADSEQAVAVRLEISRARRAVEQARSALRLQKALARPDPELLSGYKRTAGFNTFLWGVQLSLPFTNRNQGNVAAADSEIRVAESRLAAAEAEVRAEVQIAWRDVQNRRERLSALMSGALQRAEESVNIARSAYREGGTDLLRLLDAERVFIELEVQSARLRAEYRQSLVTLETAMGVEP